MQAKNGDRIFLKKTLEDKKKVYKFACRLERDLPM